jgi:hypothetical protein
VRLGADGGVLAVAGVDDGVVGSEKSLARIEASRVGRSLKGEPLPRRPNGEAGRRR